jgi:hypothetical protein
VEIRPLGAADAEAVQALIESDPGYTERITGSPPGAADAQSLLTMRPPGLSDEAKVVLGVFEGGDADDSGGHRTESSAGRDLVAVVDLLRGYPEEPVAFVGLLQVRGGRQG